MVYYVHCISADDQSNCLIIIDYCSRCQNIFILTGMRGVEMNPYF